MKRILVLMMGLSLLLAGCGKSENNGLFHHFIVEPISQMIIFFGDLSGGSYGLGIIFVTLIIRLLIMPLMLSSYKKQRKMQHGMKKLKPQIDEINLKMKTATPEEKQVLTQDMMKLYGEHGINPMNMGCLPILIQMPILMGLYYAISHSDKIASDNFLWFNLGSPDMMMMLVAGGMYFLQSYVSFRNMPETSREQMKMMMYISPIMIMFVSFHSPSALPLYWATGAVILIFQTIISKKYFDYEEEQS